MNTNAEIAAQTSKTAAEISADAARVSVDAAKTAVKEETMQQVKNLKEDLSLIHI